MLILFVLFFSLTIGKISPFYKTIFIQSCVRVCVHDGTVPFGLSEKKFILKIRVLGIRLSQDLRK